MLVTWVKCQVIFENGGKNVKLLFALLKQDRFTPFILVGPSQENLQAVQSRDNLKKTDNK